MMDEMQKTLEKACKEISENHHKILDDWCKAYLAELYDEGCEIKPGNFVLCEQETTLNNDGFLGKKYWFRLKTDDEKALDDLDEEYVHSFIDWPDLARRQLEYNERRSKILEIMSEVTVKKENLT